MTLVSWPLFRIASVLALHFPREVAYDCAHQLGLYYAIIQRQETKAIRDNFLQMMGNDVDEKQLGYLVRQIYINFAKYLVDFFRIPKVDGAFIRKHVSLNGLDNLDEALGQKRGCILLTAHLGSWEIGGAILACLGYPIDVMALTHQNPWIEQFFLHQRLSKGIRSIPLQSALKGALTLLKQNHLVAILGDRDYTHHGVPVQFFGKQVSLPKGTAYLSLKTGAPIVPIFVLRREDDGIQVSSHPPIDPSRLGNDFSDEAIAALTQQCARLLEDQIRLYPTQWLVFRRFWEPIIP